VDEDYDALKAKCKRQALLVDGERKALLLANEAIASLPGGRGSGGRNLSRHPSSEIGAI
jgi:hypothetical protein